MANKIDDLLYLGDKFDGQEVITSNSLNFDAFINVSRYENYSLQRKAILDYFKIPMRVSGVESNYLALLSAYYALDYCQKRGMKTLICCSAGKVRSASVVILWVSIKERISLNQSFILVKSCRKVVDFRPEFVTLCETAKQKIQA